MGKAVTPQALAYDVCQLLRGWQLYVQHIGTSLQPGQVVFQAKYPLSGCHHGLEKAIGQAEPPVQWG